MVSSKAISWTNILLFIDLIFWAYLIPGFLLIVTGCLKSADYLFYDGIAVKKNWDPSALLVIKISIEPSLSTYQLTTSMLVASILNGMDAIGIKSESRTSICLSVNPQSLPLSSK